jgi:tetratricopeptide (TPR) repeat protein
MRLSCSLSALCVLVVVCACASAVAGQSTPPAGSHVHYAEPANAQSSQASPTGALAPRLQNLGSHTFPVSTRNGQAQAFMNQGLNLAYAFNHAEARRAFREAARLDPDLAMAYWGQALVLGPNINALMEPNEEPQAYELVQKAASMKARVTPREQAYIDALTQRYSGTAADRQPRDAAYADAMRRVHERFPDDLDAAMLYVESVMDLRPWGYWQRDGAPHARTGDIVALTERVLARNPKHPGAVHMYIHLMEGTATPEKAEQAADTLLTLMPAAGHMVHMPAHIYQRVGRYADAIKSNQLAVLADEDYITQCRLAIQSARQLASKIDDDTLKNLPLTAAFRMVPYYALTRFGHWDEMLKEPEPPAFSAVLRAVWHYARGLSLVAQNRIPAAEQELRRLIALTSDPSMKDALFSPNPSSAIIAPAPAVLAGEIAAARGDYDLAISQLDRAVRLDDSLVYTEPSEFHFPPRLALGALLLQAGRAAEAETVYWEDLRRNRENGWALFGLLQALRAQNKLAEAALTEARFKAAWARADVTLASSRFGR